MFHFSLAGSRQLPDRNRQWFISVRADVFRELLLPSFHLHDFLSGSDAWENKWWGFQFRFSALYNRTGVG